MRRYGFAFYSFWCYLVAGWVDFSAAVDLPEHERGYAYVHEENPAGPWSIHIFKVDLSRSGLGICTTLGKGGSFGVATVAQQVKGLPADAGQPLAAINGDFFDTSDDYGGGPRDLQIYRGQMVRNPAGHACFWIDATGKPHMTNLVSDCKVLWPNGKSTPFDLNIARPADGCVLYTPVLGASTRTSGGTELVLERVTNNAWLPLRPGNRYSARVREVHATGNSPLLPETMVLSLGPKLAARLPAITPGSLLQIGTDTIPSLAGVETALGGGPTLVRDRQAMHWSGINVRTPRAAIGWNKDFLFLVEVDGRQRTSAGMTFPEFANYLVKLGCESALNLDGGGSSTLWVMGTVVNSPSEGRERASANSVVVVQQRSLTQGK